mgnify:FL=1
MNRQQEKITALYCRIDSGKQNDLFAQYEQIQSLLDYARKRELPNPHFFCDWGYSGTTDERPEYRRMLQAVTSGHVANLVVTKLDRLIRGNVLDCGRVVKTVLDNAVTLHILSEDKSVAGQAVHLASTVEAAYRGEGAL